MGDYLPAPAGQQFPLCYRPLFAVVALVAACLLYSGCHAVDETVSRLDTDIAVLKVVLAQYKAEFDVFPAGDTEAIFRALRGENPKNIKFIEREVVDPRGTP